jgi:hypothetical protein
MKEITNRKTKNTEFVTDQVWASIVARGWAHRFTKKDMPERKLNVPVLPPMEVKVTKPKTKK